MCYTIIIISLNLHNHSKTSAFEKFKGLLYIYPRFVKACKNMSNPLSNRLGKKQFLVLLYDCMPNGKHFMSIGKLLQHVKVLQEGMGKHPTIALYCKPKT